MHFKKIITLWALFALMLGQIALAHHNAVHIDHAFSQEIFAAQDYHEHEQQEDQKHQCPECILTKSLLTAFYNSPATLSSAPQVDFLSFQAHTSVIALNRYTANAPRAPPTFLI